MMVYIREFEFYESESCMLVSPCDMEGGTFGDNLQDAAQSAADWLKETINDDLAHGRQTPGGKLDHKSEHGGRIVAIAVDCDLNRIDAVTAADAARILGVSSARIAQMCESGRLTSWRQGSRRMVARSSLEARLAESPKAGRPKKARMA